MHRALVGALAFGPDGMAAETRAGLNSRNIAISRDGRHVAVANTLRTTGAADYQDDLAVTATSGSESTAARTNRSQSFVGSSPSRVISHADIHTIMRVSDDVNAP